MNYCNRRLLLPLDDDGLTVDDIILTYLEFMMYQNLKKIFLVITCADYVLYLIIGIIHWSMTAY